MPVILLTVLTLVANAPATPPASSTDLSTAHRLVSVVDYIAADYAGAVDDSGNVLNEFEFREHVVLSREAATSAARLASPSTAALLGKLNQIITDRATPAEVARVCAETRRELVERFALPTFPASPPDRGRGEQLYRQNCAVCHGDDGRGLTDLRERQVPPPTDFHAPEVAERLSPFRIFNTTSFGVPGTAMPAFGEATSESDRWALAFFVPTLRLRDTEASAAPTLPWGIAELAVETDGSLLQAAIAHGLDRDRAHMALAYARTRAPFEASGPALDVARRYLDASLTAARAGRWDDASAAALRGYLDGIEPVEGPLRAIQPRLTAQIEAGFLELREAIRRRVPLTEVEALTAALGDQVDTASRALDSPQRSGGYAFVGAFFIVLREGVEAALVIGALLTILRRANAGRGMVRQVHFAWLTALGAGILTWLLANRLVPVDAAQRELAEGIIALVAAALLFSASYWLLSNLEVRRWMDFLKHRVTSGLGGTRRFTLFTVSFLAVYREAFETVLFLQAMLLASDPVAVLAGVLVAAIALGLVVFLMFKIGARLPIKAFFAVSSGLLGLLAFVLAGQGIHALQQVGVITAARVPIPDFPSLGIHATLPGLAVQGLIVLLFAGAIVHTVTRRERGADRVRPQH